MSVKMVHKLKHCAYKINSMFTTPNERRAACFNEFDVKVNWIEPATCNVAQQISTADADAAGVTAAWPNF